MSIDGNWLQRFRDAGALWEYREGGPHASYEMASKHAGFYFNTDVVASDPALVGAIAGAFAQECAARNIRPDWVVSCMAKVSSGLILAAKLAEVLGARFGSVDLREEVCRFRIAPGQTILLVTDDIHSGASLVQTIGLIERAGGEILPVIFTMGNFYGAPLYKGMAVVSLFELEVETYRPGECPLCKKGSRALNARQMWHELIEGKMA